jgi:serine/threonine protein kinase
MYYTDIDYAHYQSMNHVLIESCLKGNADDKALPELFLWHVYFHLANACCHMRDKEKLGQECVHTDIKSSNIFVNEGGNKRPAYKTPGLGDSGNYKILGVDHIVNDVGTPGF